MNNTIIFGNGVKLVGIKEFLRRFVIVRGVGPMLYLKFPFRGNNVDNLCPGRDVMEFRSLSHSATCLACNVVIT